MSRFRLTFALGISFALIATATWYRVTNANISSEPSLVVVNDSLNALNQDIVNTDNIIKSVSSTTDSKSLTQTDFIGRQLFSDYIGLMNKGQATDQNLNNLAASYAKTIAEKPRAKLATSQEIKVISDTIENLKSYSEAISKNRTKYQQLVAKSSVTGTVDDPSSQGFESLMERFSDLYNQSANELKLLPVPAALKDNHIALINNYLSSAEAMKALAKTEVDPVEAYSALNTQATNSAEEQNLLLNIQKTLMANGIIFDQGYAL